MSRAKTVLLVLSLAGAVAAAPLTAGAQAASTATLVVTKSVEGAVPAGTEFTVEVDCPTLDPNATSPTENPRTLTFTEDGGSQELDVFVDIAPDCTVTETVDGGAETVTYAAGASTGNCLVTPVDGSALGEFDFAADSSCEVVITNAFAEPEPPAPPVAPPAPVTPGVQPSFTG